MRDELLWFAMRMEKVLRENDDKDSWDTCSIEYLLSRLEDEVKELKDAFGKHTVNIDTYKGTKYSKDHIIKEAVDVANFAMMIADNIKNDVLVANSGGR